MLMSISSPFCQHIIMIKTYYHDNMFLFSFVSCMLIAYRSGLKLELDYP